MILSKMVEGAKLKFVSLTSVRGLFVSNHFSKRVCYEHKRHLPLLDGVCQKFY